MVTAQGHGSLGGSNKLTKARSNVVKPILKKLSSSEKGSLDLDRGWDDQQLDGMWEPVGAAKSAKDVSFSFGSPGARGGLDGRGALSGKEGFAPGSGNVARTPFQQHARSQSGNSVATNGSGGARVGSFVHPFQQMPRTTTPPLSYANSLASFDNGSGGAARDYSPTITENEDDDADSSLASHLHLTKPKRGPHHTHQASSSSTGRQPTLPTHASNNSQTGKSRPSFASQRTSSSTDIASALSSTPQLRVSTNGRSTPITSRLAPSKSDLHLNLGLDEHESPVGSLSGTTITSAAAAPSATLVSSSSSNTPMSPLRTSLEAMGIPTPRLRSRSEVDTAARQEHIRQARRKFEERERAKEAKYEREEVERRNRQANKEAARIERETKEWYKTSGVSSGGVIGVAGYAAGGSNDGSSVNVDSSLHGDSVLQAPPACATAPGRPSIGRRTSPTSSATSASVPTHPPSGRSVGAGVFGGKRKGSFGLAGAAAGSMMRPDAFAAAGGYASTGSSSRKNSELGKENRANVGDAEKGVAFLTNNYDSLPEDGSNLPRFGAGIDDADPGARGQYDWRRARPQRSSSAKKKTQTYWQGFVLWLRTRIFKLRRR